MLATAATVVALLVGSPCPSQLSRAALQPRLVAHRNVDSLELRLDEVDAPQQQAPQMKNRTRGGRLILWGVAALGLGAVAYWDANYRSGRPKDGLYTGLGTATAYALWGGGTLAIGWGAWQLANAEPPRPNP